MLKLRTLSAVLSISIRICLSAEDKPGKKPSPTCIEVSLTKPFNNAKDIADSLNGITEGVTVKALGSSVLMICGDNTNSAVSEIASTAGKLGTENTAKLAAHDSHVIRLFFNRDAGSIATILKAAFPKLTIAAVGADAIAIGSADGSDAALSRHAKRWAAALDVPRPEVTLNAWSVQISNKDPDVVERLSTVLRKSVGEHNRQLQEALQRAHAFLAIESANPEFYAPVFRGYLAQRYAVPGSSSKPINVQKWNACSTGTYCLGYEDLFQVQPTISSMLAIVVAARNPATAGANLVDRLEGKAPRSGLVKTRGYSQFRANTTPMSTIYQVEEGDRQCDQIAEEAYAKGETTAPLFPCLRESLSDSTKELATARLRVAIADFLYHYKFTQQYPDDFDPTDASSRWLDANAAPLLTAFNRDMAGYLRHLQEEVSRHGEFGSKKTQYASNGIVTLSTLSTIPSSVATSTQNEFAIPPAFSLKDFLAGSVPPTPAQGQTTAAATAAKLPAFLASNLVPGVALPLMAGLSMDTTPAVASLGRGLNLIVTSYSLPGGSAAELNVNLTSQDEAPPAIQRGSTSKVDTRSRVAKHNLQTMVRVDSMRLFELSAFSAELRRGGESIPIIPPFVELPIIGSLVRWPVHPDRIYHRSFAVVSAVVLPTAADLVASVRPSPDIVVSDMKVELQHEAPKGTMFQANYTLVANRQDTSSLHATRQVALQQPPAGSPVKLSWNSLGSDVRYDLYRTTNGVTVRVASDLAVTHYSDDGTREEAVTRIPDPTTSESFSIISPTAFLAGSVPAFHEKKLECISREALSQADPAKADAECRSLKLSDFATMR